MSAPGDDGRSPQDVALARLRRRLERESRAQKKASADRGITPRDIARVDRGEESSANDGTLAAVHLAAHADAAPAVPRARAAAAGATRAPAHHGAAVRRPRATTWAARIDAYERLIRLDKPIGWLLLLWPTLTALWISCWGTPSVSTIVILVAGTILMRSAGCAFNDWADRDFDAAVKRTADRPLATGEVSPREALAARRGARRMRVRARAVHQPADDRCWSFPALAIALAYPFMKRFLALPQAFLGIAFSFGIPMAFAAQTEQVPAIAWWLLLINLFWVVAYDTEYAMVDRDDDLRLGMRTSAITFGRYDVFAVACCYAINLAGMAVVGWQRQLPVAVTSRGSPSPRRSPCITCC